MSARGEAFQDDAAWARAQDEADELSRFRARFELPRGADGAPLLYFAGHSLGPMPRRARDYVNEELDAWSALGVEGHFAGRHPWLPYHALLTGSTARLLGAEPHEVVVMNTLTVNLHLMMATFYRPTPKRSRILVEEGAFPSDRHAVATQARWHGFDPRAAVQVLAPRPGEALLRSEDILETLARDGESIALVLLGSPNFLTGQAFALGEITRAAHERGCSVGFDLAHGAGNLAPRLHEVGCDFAVWCNYKYLNAGPGGLGGAFVHARHGERPDLLRLAGWWGHEQASRFEMRPDFVPALGADGWQLSNPPILQLAALRASMELFDEAGMEALRARGDRLTAYLEWLLARLPPGLFTLLTPRAVGERGSMLTLRVHGDATRLEQRLRARGAVCDLRPPDILRVTPAPRYSSFADVHALAGLLGEQGGLDA